VIFTYSLVRLSFSPLWFICLVLFDFLSCTVFVLSPVLVRCLVCVPYWYGVCFVQICIFASIQIQYRFNNSSVFNVANKAVCKYSGHLYFVISIVGLKIKSFYAINSDVVSLFADSSFLVFSDFEYVMILIDLLY
jgi:hypothetical protein